MDHDRILTLAGVLCLSGAVAAQTPTWTDNVACIVYSHCAPCHRDGGIAPMSLLTYADAFNARTDIRDATALHLMPPWPPDPSFRSLAHERVLMQEEIDIIAAWADGGAPQGDPGNAPPPPIFDNAWVIASPDLSVRMADYTIPALTDDMIRSFVVPSGNTIDQFITAFEVIPGNHAVVHHVVVFQDTSGVAQALDDATPEPGYVEIGGVGVNGALFAGFWVPGSQPWFAPTGMGVKLLANADLVFQMHYPLGSDGELDSTRINFQLSTNPFLRTLDFAALLEHTVTMTDGPLLIAPNTIQTFHNQFTLPIPLTITTVIPHSHLICTSMKSWAVDPWGNTIPLIDIPDWDFQWQGLYDFRKPIHLAAGTVFHGEATYDNTSANPDNPNDPPQWIGLGEATTDEMMIFAFGITYGFAIDTTIVIDTAAHATHYLECEAAVGVNEVFVEEAARIWPTPAHDRLNIDWRLATASMRLVDVQGRVANEMRLTTGANAIDVGSLARGAYVAEINATDGRRLHRSIVVLE